MINLAIVGAGECYRNYYLPATEALNKEGIARITTVIDVRNKNEIEIPEGSVYLKRPEQDTLLSLLLAERNADIVCLSHPNSFHVKDAEDVIEKYKTILEKPYALDRNDSKKVRIMVNNRRLGLGEYYLFGKTAPLHILSGIISSDSFYLTIPGLLTGDVEELKKSAGRLNDIIGNIQSIHTEVLEGEGGTGHVLNRTPDLSIAKNGGGMLHDLGTHALSPVDSITYKFGSLRPTSVDIAVCEEHLKHFANRGVNQNEIAETYAKAQLMAGNIPVTMILGKYVLGGPEKGRNQRRLCVLGSRGKIDLDMSRCEMAVYEGDSIYPKWSAGVNRTDFPKYYGPLRAAIETLDGRLNGELTQVALNSQEYVIDLLDMARTRYGSMKTYKWGSEIDEIERLKS